MLPEILVCPLCHAALEESTCTGCRHVFSDNDGVPNLTPIPPPDKRVRARWGLWEKLQANGQRAYELDPRSSLSVGERPDAEAFAQFADLHGLVLDVGCGVQALPTYGRGLDGRLVGVDPLRGERDREFEFVQAIAEYLPFPDRTFDRVLFATSIDHVLVPQLAVAEARRVTKAHGSVCLWLGEVPQRAAEGRRERFGRWMSRPPAEATVQTLRGPTSFPVPAGAVDPFHVSHPDARTVTGWLERAALTVHAVERPVCGHCFVRAIRD